MDLYSASHRITIQKQLRLYLVSMILLVKTKAPSEFLKMCIWEHNIYSLTNHLLYHYISASQPFFNHGTLSCDRSPDGTLRLWHLFHIQDLHMMYNMY